jgi:hypothetical protein
MIDAFGVDKLLLLFLQPAADLLWAPLLLRQLLFDLADDTRRHLTWRARCERYPLRLDESGFKFLFAPISTTMNRIGISRLDARVSKRAEVAPSLHHLLAC